MALSSANKSLMYQLFGLPQSGTAVYCDDLTHKVTNTSGSANPSWGTMDFTGLNAQFEAQMAAMSATTQALVEAQLATYSPIATSPMKVTVSQTSQGVIVDHVCEAEKIRDVVGNLIGFAAPRGGFTEYYSNLYGEEGAAGSAGRGDR